MPLNALNGSKSRLQAKGRRREWQGMAAERKETFGKMEQKS